MSHLDRWEPGSIDRKGEAAVWNRKHSRLVGKVARRKDGLAKVTGVEVYASDVELPYMFHARVLRSPHDTPGSCP